MKVAVRVDASVQIGTGHFMRCLTLADGLRRRGVQVRFVSRELPTHLRDMLLERGMEFAPLSNIAGVELGVDLAHAHWLKASQIQDAADTAKALSEHCWDWLVVDHYALDSRWESALRGTAKRIIAIDDLADREHDCDILLDQNFYFDMQERYLGKVPQHCRLLLGPRHALLREEFRVLRKQVAVRGGPIRRLLVFFGGMDVGNDTGTAIEALSIIDTSGMHVDVVIGVNHPSIEQIKNACGRNGFECHIQTTRMAELMAAADLAIGAGGVATWERCCLGLPALAVSTADNQKKQLEDAARAGLVCVPDISLEDGTVLAGHISALLANPNLREHMSRHAMAAVEGLGVSFVISAMGVNGIEMRVACQADSENLFQWRNHPSIRAVSRNPAEIAWQDHQRWLDAVLNDGRRILLIGHLSGVPAGVVRFDMDEDGEAEVSIYVVPEMLSRGLGAELLRSAEDWLAANVRGYLRIRAHVLGENIRSQRLFSDAGYRIESFYYLKELH